MKNRSRISKKKQGKKQKLWKMRGCASKKRISGGKTRKMIGPVCPICGKNTCNHKKMRGGCDCDLKFFGGSSIPLAMGNVGAPYSPATLPGSTSIGGNNNYYAQNLYNKFDPQTQGVIGERVLGPIRGGSKSKGRGRSSTRRKRHGGSNFLPQDMVNVGRLFTNNLGSAYNSLTGYPQPANPLPWVGQLSKSIEPVNVKY